MTTIRRGTPYPPGATWDGVGVNFALVSESATCVELCLFDTPDAPHEAERITLPAKTGDTWHGYLPGAQPGLLYGYRVHGPYAPEEGQRFNPAKLLVDPYTRAVSRPVKWNDALFGYPLGNPQEDLIPDERDSAPYMPRCLVVDPAFDWGADRPPRIPMADSLIYELHVKGFTLLNEAVPEPLRGTYAGLASPPVIQYLQELGVTAVELLPIHAHADEHFLFQRGLVNYWGYNTLGFFAPDVRLSSAGEPGGPVREFKEMVKALHAAGIEVILDVVYNHTADGNHLGPTLSLRGIDNRLYYWLVENQPRYYLNYTGTGNTLNVLHPRALQLVMDSLRYWVTEMHVDGFRFDLAVTLGRTAVGFDRRAGFFTLAQQDPVLSQVKLIAEPWDIGPGGYQVGYFPQFWAEWNGKFRDGVRRFWNGHHASVAEMAHRLAGSPDLYADDGRPPYAGINFVTAHDGFTLRDLVSYNQKHNAANGEDNRDGDDYNHSWNCGVEGPTDDPAINALRAQQQRNFLATLLLAQGTPMLPAGDERGRTQQGNNNAYCQDSAISWVTWELGEPERELLAFVQRLIRLRREHPALRRTRFFRSEGDPDECDLTWWRADGQAIGGGDWEASEACCLGMLLDGPAMREQDAQGNPISDDMLLLLLNATPEATPFTLPGPAEAAPWELLLDTSRPDEQQFPSFRPGGQYDLPERALALLRRRR